MIELSVITINYNGLKDTCELIETLPLDNELLEVIVVDNASANDEATVIEQRFPQVTVLRSDQNLGFAGGNNLGIRAAQGKYLYFLNNDTVLIRGERKGESENYVSAFQPLINRLKRQEWYVPSYAFHGATIPSSLSATPHSLPSLCATAPSDMAKKTKGNTIRHILPHTHMVRP